MLTATILPNGNLSITADAEAREWLLEQCAERRGGDDILWEGLEPCWANGSFEPFDGGAGNPFVGLTSAPCIAESMDVHDDGEREIVGRCWWFPNYAITSPVDELIENGEVIFTLAA